MQNRSFRRPLMLITNNQEGWNPTIFVFNILMKMNNRTMERKVGTKVQKLKLNFIKILTQLCFDLSSKLVCLWLWRIHTVAVLTFTSVCPSCFSSTIHTGRKGVRKSYWKAIKNETEKFFKVRACLEGIRCYAWSFDHSVPDPSSVPSH